MSTSSTVGGQNESGSNPFKFTCPSGNYLTGVKWSAGSNMDSLQGLYCTPKNQIDTAAPTAQSAIAGYTAGGNPYDFKCPQGSAIDGYTIGYNLNGVVNHINWRCSNIQTPTTITPSTAPSSGPSGETVTSNVFKYLTGISGNAYRYVDNMEFTYEDPALLIASLYTDSGKAACCMGTTDKSNCTMTGQTPACDTFMNNYCRNTPAGQADPRCSCINSQITCPNKFDKNCIANLGYRTTDMANTQCPDIMNCTQFLNLSPGAQAVATNFDQSCSNTTSTVQNTNAVSQTAPAATVGGISAIWLVIILVFVLLIVSGIILYFTLGRSDDSEEYQSSQAGQQGQGY
jgi:hypothetical protein